jgi:hypothetical protein
MAAQPQSPAVVECKTPEGRTLAQVLIWPPRDSEIRIGESHPLVRWSEAEARERGEEPVQMRERGRYILGAFAVRPRADGSADGLEALSLFLDGIIEHLANRTTARERVSYHVAEAYELKEEPVRYGSLELPESDTFGTDYRALPPAEHFIVVAWFDSPEQLEWTREKGIANVRLGKRAGTWHVPPEIASARHLLLRTHGSEVAPGLWRLINPGYKVFTDADLLKSRYPGTAGGEIYAVFEVVEDDRWKEREWDGDKLMTIIKAYESSLRHRLIHSLGRTSPYPRVLPLRELLKARK